MDGVEEILFYTGWRVWGVFVDDVEQNLRQIVDLGGIYILEGSTKIENANNIKTKMKLPDLGYSAWILSTGQF